MEGITMEHTCCGQECSKCSNMVILQADVILKNIETDKFVSLPIN